MESNIEALIQKLLRAKNFEGNKKIRTQIRKNQFVINFQVDCVKAPCSEEHPASSCKADKSMQSVLS